MLVDIDQLVFCAVYRKSSEKVLNELYDYCRHKLHKKKQFGFQKERLVVIQLLLF